MNPLNFGGPGNFNIFNLNSSYNIDHKTKQFIINKLGFLSNTWREVPIYLINEGLMDDVCPREYRIFLNQECVGHILEDSYKQLLEEADAEIEAADEFWERLTQCRTVPDGSICRGVYLQLINACSIQSLENEMLVRIPFIDVLGDRDVLLPGRSDLSGVPKLEEFKKLFGRVIGRPWSTDVSEPPFAVTIINCHESVLPHNEAIFICTERIIESAKKVKSIYGFKYLDINEIAKAITTSVILHELVHAYLKTDARTYNTLWGRLIEESLVQAYVMASLKDDTTHNAVLNQDMQQMPLEYRAYIYFEQYNINELRQLLQAWKRNDAKQGIRICPTRGLFAQFGGRNGPWPTTGSNKTFDDYTKNICCQPENYWKIIAKEILGVTMGI